MLKVKRAGSVVKILINEGNFVIKVNAKSHDVGVTEYVCFFLLPFEK